jgi:hypothetical protein
VQPGYTRAPTAYYVAVAALVLAVVVGVLLFVLLSTRQSSEVASFVVTSQEATPCPAGSGAPACYSIEVTNVGTATGRATCVITPAADNEALFLNEERSSEIVLIPNETRPILVKVIPTGASSIAGAPLLSCN